MTSFSQWLVLLLGFGMAWPAAASVVEAKGSAVLGQGSVVQARKLALQDAMRQALLQGGASVQSDSKVDLNILESDSVRVRATGVVKDVVVLDEWLNEDDGLYYVSIRARVEPQEPEQQRINDGRYRKKVAVAQFHVLDRYQIHDLPGIEIALAKDLMGRLERQAGVLSVDATRYLLPKSGLPYLASGSTSQQVISDLSQTLGVQFILDGIIMDMGKTEHLFGVGLRHIEVELTLYDGITGSVVSKFRDSGTVWEQRLLDFPTTTPALNEKFFAAPIGQETDKVLRHLADLVSLRLQSLPFTARVVRAKANQVYFDVGAMANIQVGDVFMTYRLSADPLLGVTPSQQLGYQESPVTSLIVKRVQPLFAIGELEVESVPLKAGDVVRFTW